jgi:hypothetical protein
MTENEPPELGIVHHDNPIAKLTDKQLAELDRVTSGEREE